MKGFGPTSFGELYADRYDEELKGRIEETTALSVEFLAALAPGGRALELAIGTGRVALPLAARGLTVHGTDASAEMIAKMREKPGGDAIPATVGDMSDVLAEGTFDLAYLVFNTIFNLTTQEAQIRLFANVAEHLNPGGVFVVETVLPQVSGFVDGQQTRGRFAAVDAAGFEVQIHDPVLQTIDYQRIVVTEQGTRLAPLKMRYAYPSELDLMARLAGLRLRDRFDWWDKTPFTDESKQHVSVWEKPAQA